MNCMKKNIPARKRIKSAYEAKNNLNRVGLLVMYAEKNITKNKESVPPNK